VRPDIVEQRYISGLRLLSHYFEYPDVLELFDNTISMELIAEVRKSKIIFLSTYLPGWVVTYLGSNLKPSTEPNQEPELLNDIGKIRMKYRALKEKYKK